MSSAYKRAVLPSRSFISARPTSKKCGRQLTEFSLCAIFEPDGTIGNHSVQLHWSDTQLLTSNNNYDQPCINDCYVTDKTRTSTMSTKLTTGWSDSTAGINTVASKDAFVSEQSAKTSTKKCYSNLSKAEDTGSPAKIKQTIRMVYVELRIVYFDYPGVMVRKSIVKEFKNNVTMLHVLQQLIKQSGIIVDTRMNSEIARLYRVREYKNGKPVYDDVDYLQWRCGLLAEMSDSDSFEFLLDCTDSEDHLDISYSKSDTKVSSIGR